MYIVNSFEIVPISTKLNYTCKILVRFFSKKTSFGQICRIDWLKVYPASLHPVYFELKLNSPNKLTVRMIITFHCSWVHAKLSDGVYVVLGVYVFQIFFDKIHRFQKALWPLF